MATGGQEVSIGPRTDRREVATGEQEVSIDPRAVRREVAMGGEEGGGVGWSGGGKLHTGGQEECKRRKFGCR